MAGTAVARTTSRKAPGAGTAGRTRARRNPRAAGREAAASATARRRRHQTPIVGFVPIAAARTAGAVGGIADSGIVVRLTRGRLWIGTLATLLVGIVGLNVLALSFNSSSSEAGRAADALERQNSTLRAELADRLSTQQVQAAARDLGLVFAAPGAIGYLKPSPDDPAEAARRLRHGELSASEPAALAAPAAAAVPVTAAPAAAIAPEATTVPTDPAALSTDPSATATGLATPGVTATAGVTATPGVTPEAAVPATDATSTAPATSATTAGGVTP